MATRRNVIHPEFDIDEVIDGLEFILGVRDIIPFYRQQFSSAAHALRAEDFEVSAHYDLVGKAYTDRMLLAALEGTRLFGKGPFFVHQGIEQTTTQIDLYGKLIRNAYELLQQEPYHLTEDLGLSLLEASLMAANSPVVTVEQEEDTNLDGTAGLFDISLMLDYLTDLVVVHNAPSETEVIGTVQNPMPVYLTLFEAVGIPSERYNFNKYRLAIQFANQREEYCRSKGINTEPDTLEL